MKKATQEQRIAKLEQEIIRLQKLIDYLSPKENPYDRQDFPMPPQPSYPYYPPYQPYTPWRTPVNPNFQPMIWY